MSLADDVLQSVAASIEEYGAPVIVSRKATGDIDPATGEPSTSTTSTINTFMLMDATSLKTLGFRFGDGLVQGGDMAGTVAADKFASRPVPGDLVEVTEGEYAGVYKVAAVRPQLVGSTPVTFELLVRP